MPNRKTSQLTDGSAIQSDDYIAIVRDGVNYKVHAGNTLAQSFVDNETPAGTINGTDGSDGNAVFTLAQAPSPAASLMLHKTDIGTAVLTVAGIHYNLSGLTITYTANNIPIAGQTHRASYRY